jgi:hypothetical protein
MTAGSPQPTATQLGPRDADQLVERVMATVRLTDQARPASIHSVRWLAAGLVVAAVVIGGFLTVARPNFSVGAGPSMPPASPTALAFHEAGLRFLYPADWAFSSVVPDGPFGPYYFVGSVPATKSCQTSATDGFRLCVDDAHLTQGSVVIRVLVVGSPLDEQGNWFHAWAAPRHVVVGGLPALTGANGPNARIGADVSTTWILPSPQDPDRHYILTAAIRGPGLSALQAQVDTVISTISFDPPSTQPTGAPPSP